MDTDRTHREGPDAVQAAIEEFDLRSRIDEPDPSTERGGDLDLRWAHSRIDAAQRAAAADVVSYEEAMEWLASTVGRELPSTDFIEEDERER